MTFPLPSGMLNQIRTQANTFFTEPISVYQITVSYDVYGREILASGLLFSTSGYVGKISGKDRDLLEQFNKMFVGTESEAYITVLWPFGNPAANDNIIKTNTKQYRVIWTNKDTFSDVKAYEKALCAEYEIKAEREKRFG